MRVHKGTYIQTERGIHMRAIIPDFRNFSFVPDILLPLLRGLGGFFLNCTTNSHTHKERETEKILKKDRLIHGREIERERENGTWDRQRME